MARTRIQIKKSFTDRFMQDAHLVSSYGLDETKTFEEQFSLTAFENVLIDVFVFLFWTLEILFDQHKKEVTEILTVLKPHTARWYRQKALDFQFGFDLYPDTDVFINEEFSQEQITSSKIIKYSAVTEATNESRLIVKIATEDGNGELAPISAPQKESFDTYIDEIRDAGVKVTIINYLPDILRLNIKIYYNPLVLTSNGVSILTGKKPVEDALKAFMKELPFNGELILSALVDKLQQTEGVDIPHLVNAASSWIDSTGTTYGAFENIAVKKIPTSGYFKIENFTNIEYIAN
ncbi:nucleotidyltransferase [Chryseobacterium koreense]